MNLTEPLDCNDIIVGGMFHHHIRKKTTKNTHHPANRSSDTRYLSRCSRRNKVVVDFCSSGSHLVGGACLFKPLHSQPEVQVLFAEL